MLRTTWVLVVAVIASAFATPVASAITTTPDGLRLCTTITKDGSAMRAEQGWNHSRILIGDKGDEFVVGCSKIGSDWGIVRWSGAFEGGRAGWFDSLNPADFRTLELHRE